MPSLHHLVALLVLAPVLATGCASPSTDDPPEEDSSSAEALSASTCSASGAAGAVSATPKAMLDTIAFSEGTAGTCGSEGYSTGFGVHCFSSCTRHPGKVWSGGGYSSSAAGRYQFLSTTWSSLGYSTFSPRNQDLGAVKLIANRGVSLPTTRALSATEFSNAMRKMSNEWASLPFSPYGQPTKSLSAVRGKYCSLAGC